MQDLVHGLNELLIYDGNVEADFGLTFEVVLRIHFFQRQFSVVLKYIVAFCLESVYEGYLSEIKMYSNLSELSGRNETYSGTIEFLPR